MKEKRSYNERSEWTMTELDRRLTRKQKRGKLKRMSKMVRECSISL